MEQSQIPWHPAFVEAIQLELEDYRDFLEFHPEFPLTAEPLKIDCVVIKKAKGVVITKNIAAIFRDANLLEYKSPDDYVSIEDFYKVYGYACLYAALEKTPITNMTVSFIESHYPQKLIEHLKNIRGYKVEKSHPGIYTVSGDILPIQIIDNRKLSADENLWLKDLDKNLGTLETQRITSEIFRLGKEARVRAYFDAIIRGNKESFREAFGMTEAFEEILEEVGLIAKWEAKGEARERLAIAQNMVNLGLPMETVISATHLDPEKVEALYQQNQ